MVRPDFTVKLYGPPGTGKTEALLHLLEEEVRLGTPPESAAFVAFGKDAVVDARRRALAAVNRSGQGADELPLFRTFHSLAWHLLATTSPDLRLDRTRVQLKHRLKFCEWYGLMYDPHLEGAGPDAREDYFDASLPFGNFVMRLDTWLTNTMTPLKDWRRCPTVFDGARDEVEVYVDRWRAYRAKLGLMEYADTLERCRAESPELPARCLFVDEFQDVSPLQVALYEQWRGQVERVYIAGDDDQCIYGFQGADHRYLRRASADETRFLSITHRFAREMGEYAARIIERVRDREVKHVEACSCSPCAARRGERPDGGRVVVLERPAWDRVLPMLDVEDSFILARTQAQVENVRGMLLKRGIPFHPLRGPDAPNAIWGRRAIAAKQFHDLMRDPAARVRYGTACGILGYMDAYRPATGAGYVLKEKLDEFRRLPERIGPTWPTSALGEDLRLWSLHMLRQYIHRVPSWQEFVDAFGVEARGRGALESHILHAPAWPISVGRGLRVGTIHASKGLQARTVLLLGDFSKRGLTRVDQREEDHDAEHRVFYVGATRAARRLIVARPLAGASFFPLPLPA